MNIIKQNYYSIEVDVVDTEFRNGETLKFKIDYFHYEDFPYFTIQFRDTFGTIFNSVRYYGMAELVGVQDTYWLYGTSDCFGAACEEASITGVQIAPKVYGVLRDAYTRLVSSCGGV